VCSVGRTRDWLVGKYPKVRGDGCPHKAFLCFHLCATCLRDWRRRRAEPRVMEVGRQMSEVGQSLFFSPPHDAVLKRHPLSLLAQEGLVCSGGRTNKLEGLGIL